MNTSSVLGVRNRPVRFRPLHTLIIFGIMAFFASMVYAVTFGQWTQTTFTVGDGTYTNTAPANGNTDVSLYSGSGSADYRGTGADGSVSLASGAVFNINSANPQS